MLVLPTATIPPDLAHYINPDSKATRGMLNGYRNKLTKSLKWVLCKDPNYCGQAFSYELIAESDKLDSLKAYENKE
jgi:hypothetical protein